MPKPLLVVATDDRMESNTLEQVLQDTYDVRVAGDPMEFVDLVELRLPDIVLISADFSGDRCGQILARQVKASARTRSIPVIQIVGRNTSLEIHGPEHVQPDEVVVRPIHIPELMVRIHTMHRIQRYQAEVVEGSRIDPLTAAFTRSYMLERLAYELRRADRYGRSLALALVDVDHLDKVNEAQGALAGDLLLREVARVLSSRVRGVDMVARSGDDEFCVVLPETSLLVARTVGERLCVAVREMASTSPEQETSISASVGVVGMPHPDIHEVPDLLRRAREAVVRARKEGGDCAQLY
jgi:diguanylate cyclase (GGDEF)-like protein